MVSLTPQVVFTVFGLSITNTVFSTWVMMAVIIIVAALIRQFKPVAGEMVIEIVDNVVSSVLPEDVIIAEYLPILGTLAIFLILANIFSVFPFMVSPTANINTTIALAVVVFISVHIYGVRKKGFWQYLKDLADPIFILPLEIVSQFSRTLSLSIRLFGNVLSTDLIVAIVFSLIPFLLPLPLAALAMLTGIIQAYIFTVLASLYIASAVEVNEFDQKRKKLQKETS